MILWRVLPWRAASRPTEPGGPLWFARELQGAGRHDNPHLYGCLYVGESPVSPVAEALAPFRGAGALDEGMLVRSRTPLALAELSLSSHARVLDLDDPRVLLDVQLRPSQVATHRRAVTRAHAAALFARHPAPAALRWWSTLESSLANLTLFDRAHPALAVVEVNPLTPAHPAVRAAAELLGLDG
ncbi:MAG: RES family NAD+ phosphorylase [Solirubrobacterales bacterium]|nr:RES family NAD+ phosphorylase [Solirubrobacterales bacterium]